MKVSCELEFALGDMVYAVNDSDFEPDPPYVVSGELASVTIQATGMFATLSDVAPQPSWASIRGGPIMVEQGLLARTPEEAIENWQAVSQFNIEQNVNRMLKEVPKVVPK